jgi:acetylornithine deacetylase
VLWRPGVDPRLAAERRTADAGDYRRADFDADRQRAKGLRFLPHPRAGPGGAFERAGPRRQRDLCGRRDISEIARLSAEARSRSRPDSGFDPPYTTLSVGTIAGGAAVNIIARDCAFDWDLRNVPDDDAAALKARIDAFIATDLLPRMRAVYPDAAVETETIVEVPPLLPDPGSLAEALARRLTGANTTTTVSFASEAGLYQQAGIPAIVCGPGSIDVAHKPDEFITRAELADGQAFLDRLLRWARSGE